MKKTFWLQKWQANQIGFHQSQVNPLLKNGLSHLNLDRGDHVFVPLCGKSQDMLYLLQKGYQVTGVELSELAVQQFFAENQLQHVVFKDGAFNVYKAKKLLIYHGDFFDLTAAHLGKVDVIYDRAALIALPSQMLEAYATLLMNLMQVSFNMLLVTLDYGDKMRKNGPPFSTSRTDVDCLFAQHQSITTIQSNNIIKDEPRFKAKGCEYLHECLYLIQHH